jgi:hypothetical protein
VFGVSGRFPWRLRSVQKVLSQMNDTTVYLYAGVLVAGMLWVVVMSEMERPMAERPFGFSTMYFFPVRYSVQCTKITFSKIVHEWFTRSLRSGDEAYLRSIPIRPTSNVVNKAVMLDIPSRAVENLLFKGFISRKQHLIWSPIRTLQGARRAGQLIRCAARCFRSSECLVTRPF